MTSISQEWLAPVCIPTNKNKENSLHSWPILLWFLRQSKRWALTEYWWLRRSHQTLWCLPLKYSYLFSDGCGVVRLSLWSRNGFRETRTGAWLMCIDNNLSLRRDLPKVTWRVHCKMWAILPPTKQAGTTKPHVFTVFDGPLGLLCFIDKQPTTLYCSASWKKASVVLRGIFQRRVFPRKVWG